PDLEDQAEAAASAKATVPAADFQERDRVREKKALDADLIRRPRAASRLIRGQAAQGARMAEHPPCRACQFAEVATRSACQVSAPREARPMCRGALPPGRANRGRTSRSSQRHAREEHSIFTVL